MVDEAVAARMIPPAAEEPISPTSPMHASFLAASVVPGAPSLPKAQRIRGLKGEREVGEVHDAVILDLALPKGAWVTRCSWHFGLAPHVIRNDLAVTCARCISRRAVEARAFQSA